MFKIIDPLIRKTILRNFFKIDLSTLERDIADESVVKKYSRSVRNALILVILAIPPILFLDYGTLVSVLIPITMVSGTAWFAISLASVKKKFENFGLELTINMFNSFVASLALLLLLTLFSLNQDLFMPAIAWGAQYPWLQLVSGLLGTFVVLKIVYDMFAGSLRYDVNDAMLTGQSEAAELFFKKSLSFLHASAENLRAGKGLEVANYYIGVSFFEIFTFIKKYTDDKNFQVALEKALKLKHKPGMSQDEADKISLDLIKVFIQKCNNVSDEKAKKSFENIKDELDSLSCDRCESQPMVDTRFSIIFEEIAEMLETQGESLFNKR